MYYLGLRQVKNKTMIINIDTLRRSVTSQWVGNINFIGAFIECYAGCLEKRFSYCE